MHYLAYRMGSERVEDPYNVLVKKLKKKEIPKINILKIGEIFEESRILLARVL